MIKISPEYPITVIFREDNEEWILNNEIEVACNLEWFDSQNLEENVDVIDNTDRSVNLIVREF